MRDPKRISISDDKGTFFVYSKCWFLLQKFSYSESSEYSESEQLIDVTDYCSPMTFGSNSNRQNISSLSKMQKSKIPQKTNSSQKSLKKEANALNTIPFNAVSLAENINSPAITDNHHKSVQSSEKASSDPQANSDQNGVSVKVTVTRACSSPRGRFISNDTSHLPPPPPYNVACSRDRVIVQVFTDPDYQKTKEPKLWLIRVKQKCICINILNSFIF